MAVRTSPLAEIKVLSLASLLYMSRTARNASGGIPRNADDIREKLDELRGFLGNGHRRGTALGYAKSDGDPIFKTVGLARQIRIDEDYGTQNVYGIGQPTRPRMVPNNYSVSVTVDRLQLDTRDLSHFLTTPEYWYADDVQRHIGIDDYLLYTYLFVRSKEDNAAQRPDIYALMPRNKSVTKSSGDVMVVNNVSLTGFKYSYEEAYFDTSNLINNILTTGAGASTSPTSAGDGPEQVLAP